MHLILKVKTKCYWPINIRLLAFVKLKSLILIGQQKKGGTRDMQSILTSGPFLFFELLTKTIMATLNPSTSTFDGSVLQQTSALYYIGLVAGGRLVGNRGRCATSVATSLAAIRRVVKACISPHRHRWWGRILRRCKLQLDRDIFRYWSRLGGLRLRFRFLLDWFGWLGARLLRRRSTRVIFRACL